MNTDCCWGSARNLLTNRSSPTYIDIILQRCWQESQKDLVVHSPSRHHSLWQNGKPLAQVLRFKHHQHRKPRTSRRTGQMYDTWTFCWQFSPGWSCDKIKTFSPNTVRGVYVKCTYWWHLRLPLNAFTGILFDVCRYLREWLYPLESHREVNEDQDPWQAKLSESLSSSIYTYRRMKFHSATKIVSQYTFNRYTFNLSENSSVKCQGIITYHSSCISVTGTSTVLTFVKLISQKT